MQNLGCPSLRKLTYAREVFCANHKDAFHDFTCAAKNVYMMRSWINENNINADVDEGDCGCNHSYNFSSPLLRNFFS